MSPTRWPTPLSADAAGVAAVALAYVPFSTSSFAESLGHARTVPLIVLGSLVTLALSRAREYAAEHLTAGAAAATARTRMRQFWPC